MSSAFRAHDWVDPAKVALRYGFVTDRIVQAVSSQKWGLATDFTRRVFAETGASGATAAGSDAENEYLVLGEPQQVAPIWEVILPTLGEGNLRSSHDALPAARRGTALGRPALFLPEPVIVDPFFDETSLRRDRSLRALVETLLDATAGAFEQEDATRIVTARLLPEGQTLCVGELTGWADGTFVYESTGAYNILSDAVFVGRYKTPILDEPSF
jgi:hypothetical protein